MSCIFCKEMKGAYFIENKTGKISPEIRYCPFCGESLRNTPQTARELCKWYFKFSDTSEKKETTTRADILDKAKQCVCQDRNDQYGEPEESLGAIAEFWETFLRRKKDVDIKISAEDASAMMVLFKIARTTTGKPKIDSWIDMAGYAACGGELQLRGSKDES